MPFFCSFDSGFTEERVSPHELNVLNETGLLVRDNSQADFSENMSRFADREIVRGLILREVQGRCVYEFDG